MDNISQISFKVLSKDNKSGTYEIEPLIRGFGHTIGSSLRRTLLSSIKGAAITKVVIEGVSHQFTTLDGVRDDVLMVLLNLKKVRFKKISEEPVELTIDFKGTGDVTAGDIEVVSGCEVVNKDHIITSLSTDKTKFKAKLTVESGYGYKDIDEKEEVPVGTLLLDAKFSPIVNVEYKVEPIRVGSSVSYEKLIMKVFTDGTVDTEAAVRDGAKTLKEFFYKIQTGLDYTEEEDSAMVNIPVEAKKGKVSVAEEILIDELGFETRTINALKKGGIRTLADLINTPEDQLFKIRNLGEKSIRNILDFLDREGYRG